MARGLTVLPSTMVHVPAGTMTVSFTEILHALSCPSWHLAFMVSPLDVTLLLAKSSQTLGWH